MLHRSILGSMAVFAEIALKDQRQATVRRFEQAMIACPPRWWRAIWSAAATTTWCGCPAATWRTTATSPAPGLTMWPLCIDKIMTSTEMQTVRSLEWHPAECGLDTPNAPARGGQLESELSDAQVAESDMTPPGLRRRTAECHHCRQGSGV